MKSICSLAILLASIFASSETTCGQDKEVGNDGKSEAAAIRQLIDSYVVAFDRGDSKSLATHWNEDGEYITLDGKKLQGRKQLADDFSAYFKEAKGAKLELLETNITILSPRVAAETGIARVKLPGQDPNESEYEAIHVKTSEGWKIDRISEQSPSEKPPSQHEQLQNLGWMIGSWVDNDENSTVETTCRWTTNKNFIVRSFKVFAEDRVDFEGTQVIGWDPHASTIRSWLFDSDGGFGVGRWAISGNTWTVRTLNVLPDGRRGTSTNTYELIDENSVQFRSTGRVVDGELLPSIAPITVSRVQE